MSEAYAGYEWQIRDTRETERKIRAFSGIPGTTSLLPMGVRDGFGPVPATVPLEATAEPGLGGLHQSWLNLGGDVGPRRMTQAALAAVEGQPEIIAETVTEVHRDVSDNGGFITHTETTYTREWRTRLPRAAFFWRLQGSSDEWTVIGPDRLGMEGQTLLIVDTEFGVVGGAGQVRSSMVDTDAIVGSEDRTVTRVYVGDLGDGSLAPPHNADIEFMIVYAGDPTPELPYHLTGMTAGELKRDLYDGVYSPRHWDTGDIMPTGIRYHEPDLLLMTEPVNARITAPVPDLREWDEEFIDRPTGWVSALDFDGRISPISQVAPESIDEVTETVSMDITSPTPDWDAGERIVNIVDYTYPRWYIPDEGEVEAVDGLVAREVRIVLSDPVSMDKHGDQRVEYKGDVFGAFGDGEGQPVIEAEPEPGARLAVYRWHYVGDRYNDGAQAIRVPVLRVPTSHWRAGTWVVVDLSWLPDYVSRRRGAVWMGQIIAIRDLDCAWREVMVEEVLPLAPPLVPGVES